MKRLAVLLSFLLILAVFGQGFSDTDEEYFAFYNEGLSPAMDKFTLMYLDGIDALGEETVYGDVSGYISYFARITERALGIPVEITVTLNFLNYNDGLGEFNGILTTVVDKPMQKKGFTTGIINFSGDSSGYIRHDLLVKGSLPYSGYYYVSQGDGEETAILWSYYSE